MVESNEYDKRLGRWLENNGISDDPFAVYEADNERDIVKFLYVNRPYFNRVMGDANRPQSAVLFSGIGQGKTATREMVLHMCLQGVKGHYAFPVRYVDFEYPLQLAGGEAQKLTAYHHACGIARQTLSELALLHENAFRLLTRLDASLLLAYAETYGSLVTRRRLRESIRKVYDEELPAEPLGEMTAAEVLANLVDLVCRISARDRTAYKSLYVLVDRVDESVLGPDGAIDLLRPLISQRVLLNLPNLAFKFFIPARLEEAFLKELSADSKRITVEYINWDDESLTEVVNQRLRYYSNGKVTDLRRLFHMKSSGLAFPQLLRACEKSPRVLLRLCQSLLYAHAARAGSDGLLDSQDLGKAIHDDNGAGGAEEAQEIPPRGLFIDMYARVYVDGKVASLGPIELRLLQLLHSRSPAMVTASDLLEALWPDEKDRPKSDNLRKLVQRLRDSLDPNNKDRFVLTERGLGYSLNLDR